VGGEVLSAHVVLLSHPLPHFPTPACSPSLPPPIRLPPLPYARYAQTDAINFPTPPPIRSLRPNGCD
jgi:hypothetical protein